MSKTADVEKKGHYELFETTKGHQILSLNDKQWFAVVKGQKGDILVRSDADHQKDHTLQEGKFYLIDFEDDPEFKDMLHIFLQEGEKYSEWLLPKGLPGEEDQQKKVVKTKEKISSRTVEKRKK